MLKREPEKAVYRILDANANRLREGLRVVEEYYRFCENNAPVTRQLKSLRHHLAKALEPLDKKKLLCNRDSERDEGRKTTRSESGRASPLSVAQASFKRCQEAARVLEEYGKIVSPSVGEQFKKLRFSLYNLEKKVIL